jgi:hypothetical protein
MGNLELGRMDATSAKFIGGMFPFARPIAACSRQSYSSASLVVPGASERCASLTLPLFTFETSTVMHRKVVIHRTHTSSETNYHPDMLIWPRS